MPDKIPQTAYAIIGGSSTFSLKFPEDVTDAASIMADNLVFETPYGSSPTFRLVAYRGKTFLTLKMHGWRQGVKRADASRQVFWVLRAAGVKKIIAEGGVGSINHLLKPKDLLIPNDYIDVSMRKDVGLDSPYLLMMRQAVCPHTGAALYAAAREGHKNRVFDRGIYVCTDGRHFESPAEVASYRLMGGDIIGQSMCPEVYLAREIGACYARLDMVVNYAEGVIKDWEHQELQDIFHGQAENVARIILTALDKIDDRQDCGCADLRQPTLLKED